MEYKKQPYSPGFTVVELLIVIVVIGILAAITVVAYSGIQNRAKDARRLSDMEAITKALELYKVDNGTYPPVSYSGLGNQSSWESSAREASGEFIAALKNYGFSGGVPVDPINNAIDPVFTDARNNSHYSYEYYVYPAGYSSCDASRGAIYVLGILRTDQYGNSISPQSPGSSCSGNDGNFSWSTSRYEK